MSAQVELTKKEKKKDKLSWFNLLVYPETIQSFLHWDILINCALCRALCYSGQNTFLLVIIIIWILHFISCHWAGDQCRCCSSVAPTCARTVLIWHLVWSYRADHCGLTLIKSLVLTGFVWKNAQVFRCRCWFCRTFISPVWKFDLHQLCYSNCIINDYWLGRPCLACILWRYLYLFMSLATFPWNGWHIWVNSYYVSKAAQFATLLYDSSRCVTASVQKLSHLLLPVFKSWWWMRFGWTVANIWLAFWFLAALRGFLRSDVAFVLFLMPLPECIDIILEMQILWTVHNLQGQYVGLW